MTKRIVAVLAIASAVACGLDFDRYTPDAATADQGNASGGDAAPDAPDSGPDVGAAPDVSGSDGADAADSGDVGTADSPACGASGEPCCTGRTCQPALTCRGGTCRP